MAHGARVGVSEPGGSSLWKPATDERPWSLIYFLHDVRQHDIPKAKINRWIDHSPDDRWQRVNLLDQEPSQAILVGLEFSPDAAGEEVSEEEFRDAASSLSEGPLDQTTQIKVRREQAFLRRALFGGRALAKCGLCGRKLDTSLLVVAHIKKRADCTPEERLDFKHVVMPMCCLGCDELYEKHLITVSGGIIQRKRPLLEGDAAEELVKELEGRDCEYWNEVSAKYFEWHASQ